MSNVKFKHESVYRGADYQTKLIKPITVCGAGALGSNLIETLVRQGFSKLGVIDFDRIEVHNINTQVWGLPDVGALKTDNLKMKMFRQVGVEITSTPKRLTESNAKSLLRGSALVVDAFDNSESRTLVQTVCRANKIPCIHAGLFADYGEVVWDANYKVPPNASGDICDYPLARNLITLVVAALAEEILDYFLAAKPRLGNWSVTLKDLRISAMRL